MNSSLVTPASFSKLVNNPLLMRSDTNRLFLLR